MSSLLPKIDKEWERKVSYLLSSGISFVISTDSIARVLDIIWPKFLYPTSKFLWILETAKQVRQTITIVVDSKPKTIRRFCVVLKRPLIPLIITKLYHVIILWANLLIFSMPEIKLTFKIYLLIRLYDENIE